jgi:hypothetical protein
MLCWPSRIFAFMTLVWLAAPACLAADAPLHWREETHKLLFDPGDGFYCYAPCAIQENDRLQLFACRNETAGVIRDHLYRLDCSADQSPRLQLVLAPAQKDGWDSFHVCDPSVIEGEFHVDGATRRYALFYLGNNVDACKNNQIGVALADDLAGPWRRSAQPIVPDTQVGHWGTGQPSAVSIDRKGRVILFYTRLANHRVSGYFRELDLSAMDAPIIGPETALPTKGLLKSNGRPDWLNNFDVVRDTSRNRYLIVREQHPEPSNEPRFISAQLQICAIPLDLKSAVSWRRLGELTPQMSRSPRNHNACFVRTSFGDLPDPSKATVIFTTAKAEPELHGVFAPWTYQLHEISATLGDSPQMAGTR